MAPKTCLECGKTYDPYRPQQKYCSADCRRIASNKRKNPEKNRAKAAEWQRNNPEKYKENQIRWREENEEHLKEYRRKYYLEHKKRSIELSRIRNKKPERKTYAKRWARENHIKNYKTTGKATRFLSHFSRGDGCCLCCFETDPFKLETHHPFGRDDPVSDIIMTFCSNHHSIIHRFPALLEADLSRILSHEQSALAQLEDIEA